MIRNVKRTVLGEKDTSTPASNIDPGQVFTGKIGTHPDWLFIKVYTTIVSLNDPNGLWPAGDSPKLIIKDYKPVEIEIEVFENA